MYGMSLNEWDAWGAKPPHRPKKLTAEQRDEIRQKLQEGVRPQELALEYHVSASLIRSLK